MSQSVYVQAFKRNVVDKYTIYNSLFAALPFSGVSNVGALLPILLQSCIEGYQAGRNPMEIVEDFFQKHTNVSSEKDKADRLFRFVQYIERQVVLFDAIEDAAFDTVNNVQGPGSLKTLFNEASFAGKVPELKEILKQFRVRIVLTAHPTQFYPGTVLGIIHDLGEAIAKNDFQTINLYIQQLGLTPFFNKKQPTPLDEAQNLMWYLENILYHSIGNIYNYIQRDIFDGSFDADNPFIELGFWPGGDRDGNPFVDAATTVKVAESLRSAIIVCYYRDIRKLKRRLTFSGVDALITQLEEQLYENVFLPKENKRISQSELLYQLQDIHQRLKQEHHSLFATRVESLINKVKIFGTWFASLDLRQDSRIHTKVLEDMHVSLVRNNQPALLPDGYQDLSGKEKIQALLSINRVLTTADTTEKIATDTLESIFAMYTIQQTSGEAGCHRYIISNCQSALNVIEVFTLFRLGGWQTNQLNVDIIPLFETIGDLEAAENIMEELYTLPAYRTHLERRKKQQTIMLGFSDGTKDGGYLQANWSIYRAKERLSELSRRYGITVKFFDGRGGPPSRGGGKTHRFYASMGKEIENKEIQITIQGQTITSNFGTIQSSQYNMEQLLSAGLHNNLFESDREELNKSQREILASLGEISHEVYQSFKAHPLFLDYLQKFSPLNYYSKSNIASRPGKRGNAGGLRFEDLRAIPFVGSWSQLKQNVPGFFGVGTALKTMKEKGRWDEVKDLFRSSLFFRTLIENSTMSMLKSFFPLTAYIQKDPVYGTIWTWIQEEFSLTEQLVLELSDHQELMQEEPVGRASIRLRDTIVLPLLTIQQYALDRIQQEDAAIPKEVYEKLVTRSMFGIINAARNSA